MKIIELIKSFLPIVSDPEGIEVYEPDSSDFLLPRLSRVSASQDVLNQLTVELRQFPEILNLEGGVLNNSPVSSARPLKVENLAHWLLAQSRFRPPEECLAELLHIVSRNASPILEIIPIWGISPKSRIDLGEGLSLVPIAELPPSRLKDLMMGKKRHAFSFEVANSSPRAGAAVVRETVHGPLFEAPNSASALQSDRQSQLMLAAVTGTPEVKQAALKDLAEMLIPKLEGKDASINSLARELCEVIALLVSKPIFALGHWYQRPENTPLVGTLAAYSGPINDHPFFINIEQQDYPIHEIEALVHQYRSLDQSIRRRLRTPLSRLNQGRRHLEHDTVEAAAIEFGISAEALLTQDRDANAPISFILRARGTLLLGGTSDERKDNYRTLRDLYDLRSTVAHEGSIVDVGTSPLSASAREKLQQAIKKARLSEQVCTDLITAIIRRGNFPDWDQLMFGW